MNDTTLSGTTSKSPGGRPRNPLGIQITRTLALKQELFGDPLIGLSECRLAIGQCSYSQLRKWISAGQIRTWRPSPRGHHKVRLSELRRFLAAGEQQSRGDA
jgi:hypothetical protein